VTESLIFPVPNNDPYKSVLVLLSRVVADGGMLDLRYGSNRGHPTTAIPKAVRPSQRKGVQSTKTKFVRSVIREVAGFSAYERRVMELLRNSKVRLARE
jgi:large subunit ribosomal protein L36e